ncbi:MAG: ISNCY family transposase [Gammaproteobacteria bacterium]|nr:ISNCY family transposase [Gammaproteobacteria bacterium]
MLMKLFNNFCLKFEKPDWSRNPEFGLIDTIFEEHPELYDIVAPDLLAGNKANGFGRGDTPSIEQIIRAAIYKELKTYNFRELEYAQTDSRICANFIKLDLRKPFSFQMFQKYISRIGAEPLNKLLIAINKIAISEGLEDLKSLRIDSTVVKTNIHYPTNNSLVWDCIKESQRLLSRLAEETAGLGFRDYRGSAKTIYYKINNSKSKDQRQKLFHKQLTTFTKSINQVDQVLRNTKKKSYNLAAKCLISALLRHLDVMRKVFDITKRREILGENVPSSEKVFSIYEPHTDIIVKGGREVLFGHKINLAGGRSNLILDCQVLDGNPSDSKLFSPTLNRVIENYGQTPRDVSVDGAYASLENKKAAQEKGITNIVFNKVVGSLRSQASSKKLETMLKKWRSGIEAVISNYKRKFEMFICNWKGKAHFDAKVLWSAIAYNIRVMTRLVLAKIALQ